MVALRVLASMAALLLFACEPPEPPEEDAGPDCGDVSRALCEAACECGGDECRFTDEQGAFSISFEEERDCRLLFGLGCSDPEAEPIDIEACIAAVDTAVCNTDIEEPGLISPTECEPPETGDAGPEAT